MVHHPGFHQLANQQYYPIDIFQTFPSSILMEKLFPENENEKFPSEKIQRNLRWGEPWPSSNIQRQINYLHEHIDHVEADIAQHDRKIKSLNRRLRRLENSNWPNLRENRENSNEDIADDEEFMERNVQYQEQDDANTIIANLSSNFGGGIEAEAEETRSSPVIEKLLNKFRPPIF